VVARVLPALLAALLLAACGEDGVTVNWDLRESHTIDDVRWPEDTRDVSATQVEPDGDVRIQLRDGTFSAPDGAIRRINFARADPRARELEELMLTSTPRTTAEARELATRWAQQWGLPVAPIEEWARKAASDPKATAFTSAGRPGAGGGAIPTVELRHSFDDERPTVVALQFLWQDG
jgi:hypothetical protein